MRTSAYSVLVIFFIAVFCIRPSIEVGFYPPIELTFNDSSITVYDGNIIDQRIFVATNRSGGLFMEIFQVYGSGPNASLSLVESKDLLGNTSSWFVSLAKFTENIAVIGEGNSIGTYIFERNATTGQWGMAANFQSGPTLVWIFDDTRMFVIGKSGSTAAGNDVQRFYVKKNDTWTFIQLQINDLILGYGNGILVATNATSGTLFIYEGIDGNFTQTQQLYLPDIVTQAVKATFMSDSDFYIYTLAYDLGYITSFRRFARLANGTFEMQSSIFSSRRFYSLFALDANLVLAAGPLQWKSGDVELSTLSLLDMRVFNGTNDSARTPFDYAMNYPSGGPITGSNNLVMVFNADKKVSFFGINADCGNGLKEQNEQCDSGTNCDSFCFCTGNLTRSIDSSILNCVPSCGNGYLDTNEECDAYFIDTCRSDCTCQSGYEPTGNATCQAICGNGVINQGELCDPGNDENCDQSCLACKTGFTLVSISCIQTEQTSTPSTTPDYVIPVAVVVPVAVIAAGATVLIVLLKRQRQRRRDEQYHEFTRDPKYVSMSTSSTPNTSNGSKHNISNSSEKRLDIPYRDITLKQQIGAGAFGKVFLGEWQKLQVALKLSSVGDTKEFRQEAKLMIDLRSHPNVVQVLGLCTDAPFPILILEYCDGGSLESVIKRAPLSEDQLIDYAFGIARGMLHLHLNNIVHRDLAARNVLIDDGVPKISDFGMARFVEEYKEGKTGNTVGPLNWMAPESLLHQKYSVKSDMWSFGCLLFELVTGKDLYENLQPMDVYHGVTRGHLHPDTPDTAPRVIKMIMTKCFEFDPDKRPTFEEVCNWLREPSQFNTQDQLAQSSSQSSSS